MTRQSFITCLNAPGCFDPCCDAPCPKHRDTDDPCGVEQGSRECFKIVCPTCKHYQERDDADKYTRKNILHEVKNATKAIIADIDPEMLGRPLSVVLIGDDGFYIRNLPAFDGDEGILIECLADVIGHLKEHSALRNPE